MKRCLEALLRLKGHEQGEIIIVDNAPSDNRTQTLVANYPVQYICEKRPGLNWARSRAANEAVGEVILFNDDDAAPTQEWLDQMCRPFVDNQVACVTGLVMPLEMETQAKRCSSPMVLLWVILMDPEYCTLVLLVCL